MSEFVKVTTGGSHRDMGLDFGRAAADVLKEFIAESLRDFPRRAKMTVAAAKRHAAARLLPVVKRRYPEYLEEVRGIAEGAGIAADDFFYLTADEEIIAMRDVPEKCSSAAVRAGRHLLLGHNEDYPPRYLSRLVVVEAHPDDAPAFLALTYPYVLAGPVCGVNAAGMAFAADSLNFPPRTAGVPTNFILRDAYRARELADVRRIMNVRGALMGNAVIAVSARERDAAIVETSPVEIAVFPMGPSGLLAHSNHVRSETLDRTGEKASKASRARVAALEHLLADEKNHSVKGLEKALSSAKFGLLRTAGKKDKSSTLATAVLDPKRHIMYVAKRGPRGHGFRPYRLGK
jgi:isopenicillin-N N-acyltransferase-like protein